MQHSSLAVACLAVGFAVGTWWSTTTTDPKKEDSLDLKNPVNPDEHIKIVRKAYAKRAKSQGTCCGGGVASVETTALALGYSEKDVEEFSHTDGTNLGESCGNPLSFAKLAQGETVVDLGSGAGFDCLLAGRSVGATGQVIGVDMTPEMIDRARRNVARGSKDVANVSFRLGEIEHLPVADGSVDVFISNCVINLSKDKQQVYQEIFRVLKPGGRIAIADVISTHELPDRLKNATALAC